MIYTKVVNTNVNHKVSKSSYLFFTKVHMINDVCKKPVNQSISNSLGRIIEDFKSRQLGGLSISKSKFIFFLTKAQIFDLASISFNIFYSQRVFSLFDSFVWPPGSRSIFSLTGSKVFERAAAKSLFSFSAAQVGLRTILRP